MANTTQAPSMSRTERLAWTVIFTTECLAVVLGNGVTIAIFYKQRLVLKRTRYILINLSLADLLVGISAMVELAAFNIWKIVSPTSEIPDIYVSFFSGAASMAFILLISLERLYAIVWPLRHRTTSTRAYVYSIVFTWFFTCVQCSFAPILTYITGNRDLEVWSAISTILAFLIAICCVYSIIWIYSKKNDPRLHRNKREHNKRLAKTLFLVTLVSVITWLPFGVTYVLQTKFDVSENVIFAGRFLHLANSFVNPLVYCYRMPEFRKTLRNILFRQDTSQPQSCPIQGRDVSEVPVLLSFIHLSLQLNHQVLPADS